MKRLSTLLAMLAVCLMAGAQPKLTPQAQLKVLQVKQQALSRSLPQRDGVGVGLPQDTRIRLVVQVADGEMAATVAAMRQLGARVESRLGDQVVIALPADNVERLSGISGVRCIDTGRKVRLNTDVSRIETGVGQLNGPDVPSTLQTPLTGKGVTLCVIDEGFDFQHRAYKDADGNSRIKAVYILSDNNGPKHTYFDDEAGLVELPGSVYDTPELIATLTTDDSSESHGQHTAAIAAGSMSPQGFCGMAPEADIVLISYITGTDGEETADEVAKADDNGEEGPEGQEDDEDGGYEAIFQNVLAYAQSYARESGKPMVISASLNNHEGPHDGTSLVSQAIDYAASFAIPVFSTGNEADKSIHAYKHFTPADNTVYLALNAPAEEMEGLNGKTVKVHLIKGGAYGYCRQSYAEGQSMLVGACLVDTLSGELLWESELLCVGGENVSAMLSSEEDEALAAHFAGKITLAGSVASKKLAIGASAQGLMQTETACVVIVVKCEEDAEMDFWEANDGNFVAVEMEGFATPGNDFSSGDWTSGHQLISVGAYCANNVSREYSGDAFRYNGFEVGQIANFSSFGQMPGHEAQPLVCAPGVFVVSAVNQYNVSPAGCDALMLWDGSPYNQMSGTSMACPTVSGIVALWLEACPTLTVDDVKRVLASTSRTDEYTDANPPVWGCGKIDAVAGLQYIRQNFPTAIRTVGQEAQEGARVAYDLQGRRVDRSAMQHGLYIAGGRKVVR